jgi:hypothetical protein
VRKEGLSGGYKKEWGKAGYFNQGDIQKEGKFWLIKLIFSA